MQSTMTHRILLNLLAVFVALACLALPASAQQPGPGKNPFGIGAEGSKSQPAPTANSPGALQRLSNWVAQTQAKITRWIGKSGGDLGAIDMIASDRKRMTRDFTVHASDEAHVEEILDALRTIEEVEVVHASDQVFLLHLGGKISIRNKVPLSNREVLSMAYTPGVARVCMAIHADPESAHRLTIKGNAVAVVTDGTAVLGLGDIGPAAAMPVMEGKAMLFKEFANIDAYPLCSGVPPAIA
jgi:malate dehydrogenase (oxaloacetate-decarboxylating)